MYLIGINNSNSHKQALNIASTTVIGILIVYSLNIIIIFSFILSILDVKTNLGSYRSSLVLFFLFLTFLAYQVLGKHLKKMIPSEINVNNYSKSELRKFKIFYYFSLFFMALPITILFFYVFI